VVMKKNRSSDFVKELYTFSLPEYEKVVSGMSFICMCLCMCMDC
jgi:hypothetical protein